MAKKGKSAAKPLAISKKDVFKEARAEVFADLIISGMNQTDAYQQLYPECTRKSATEQGSELVRTDEVQKFLKEKITETITFLIAAAPDHVKTLHEMAKGMRPITFIDAHGRPKTIRVPVISEDVQAKVATTLAAYALGKTDKEPKAKPQKVEIHGDVIQINIAKELMREMHAEAQPFFDAQYKELDENDKDGSGAGDPPVDE